VSRSIHGRMNVFLWPPVCRRSPSRGPKSPFRSEMYPKDYRTVQIPLLSPTLVAIPAAEVVLVGVVSSPVHLLVVQEEAVQVGVVFLVIVLLGRVAGVAVLAALRCLAFLDFGQAVPHREEDLVEVGDEEEVLEGVFLMVPTLGVRPVPEIALVWVES